MRPARRTASTLLAGLTYFGLAGLGLAAFGLSACGPTPEEQRAMDQQQCGGFGFQPGTDAFANCMMNVTHHREAEQAADRRAWAAQQAAARAAQDAAAAKSDSPSGSAMPDLSTMKCTSSTTTSGTPENGTTTTNTSCHN